jgi:hypothetical protein
VRCVAVCNSEHHPRDSLPPTMTPSKVYFRFGATRTQGRRQPRRCVTGSTLATPSKVLPTCRRRAARALDHRLCLSATGCSSIEPLRVLQASRCTRKAWVRYMWIAVDTSQSHQRSLLNGCPFPPFSLSLFSPPPFSFRLSPSASSSPSFVSVFLPPGLPPPLSLWCSLPALGMFESLLSHPCSSLSLSHSLSASLSHSLSLSEREREEGERERERERDVYLRF